MKPIALVLALLVGVAIGWLLRGSTASPPATNPVDRSEFRQEPEADPAPAVTKSGTVPGPGQTAPAAEPEETVDVPALRRDAAAALADGDEGRYQQAVYRLGEAGTEEAHRAILDILRDESLPGPLMGNPYYEALRNSIVPGIAAVARRRFEMNLEAGKTSWVAACGWMDLVARHGDEADIAWLVDRAESSQIRRQALDALYASPTPAARRATRRILESETGARSRLPEYARHDLHEGLRIAEAALPFVRERHAGQSLSLSSLFREWGGNVKESGVAGFTSFVLGLGEPMHRVAAVYGVQALEKRGLDVSALRTLLLDPVLVLEGDGDTSTHSKARYAIEYNPVTWTERAAAALDSRGYTSEAKQVRAGLRSPWKKK